VWGARFNLAEVTHLDKEAIDACQFYESQKAGLGMNLLMPYIGSCTSFLIILIFLQSILKK
jgi:hypothetical protein